LISSKVMIDFSAWPRSTRFWEKVQEIIDGKLIFKCDRLQVKILKSRSLKREKLICEFLEIRGGFFNVWSNW